MVSIGTRRPTRRPHRHSRRPVARHGAARAAVLLAVLGVAGPLAACDDGKRPIRIGVAGNFQDPTGRPIRLGAELAAEELNARGGIAGRPIELVAMDDHGSADSAVAVAARLYASDVVAVVGHVFSGPTLAAASVYNAGDDPVVQITPSATAPAISHAGPWTFRACPTDLAHGAALARYARERLRLGRGAVLYLNDEYGRGVRQSFVRSFQADGGTVPVAYPYLGSAPEVAPYLEDVTAHEEAEFLIVAGYVDDAAAIIREARRLGFRGPILGGDGLEGIQREGALADGVYSSAGYLTTIPTAENQRFLAAYQQRWPDAGAPNGAAAGAYDVVHLLRDVIGRAGTTRRAVREAVAGVGTATPAFRGITGTIAFDSLGDVPERQVYVGVVRDGALRLADTP